MCVCVARIITAEILLPRGSTRYTFSGVTAVMTIKIIHSCSSSNADDGLRRRHRRSSHVGQTPWMAAISHARIRAAAAKYNVQFAEHTTHSLYAF